MDLYTETPYLKLMKDSTNLTVLTLDCCFNLIKFLTLYWLFTYPWPFSEGTIFILIQMKFQQGPTWISMRYKAHHFWGK